MSSSRAPWSVALVCALLAACSGEGDVTAAGDAAATTGGDGADHGSSGATGTDGSGTHGSSTGGSTADEDASVAEGDGTNGRTTTGPGGSPTTTGSDSGEGGAGGAGGAQTTTGGGHSGGSSAPCAPMQLDEQVDVAGVQTDRITWADARCDPRSVAMARVGGGYVRQYTYELDDGRTRTATGTGAGGYQGWGFAVSHELGPWVAQDAPGEFGPVYVGRHHALYEYRFAFPQTAVDVTLSWFVATGRDNPVLAITYDLTSVGPDQYEEDTRTPYGDIAWDGDDNASSTVVSGVGWGDRYKFTTTTAPLTMNSEWDYTEENLVPYCLEWADASDAEMGAVQTQTWQQQDAGGYWFYRNWGRTSANQMRDEGQVGQMPITWNWTYQLNQYELCVDDPACVNDTTGSHRLAWGTNYGSVGQTSYPAYGDGEQRSGYPYQSYSVFMVLGPHSDSPVFRQVAEIETVQKTTLTASVGSVPAEGPGGTDRSDVVTLQPRGYDHRYGTWTVEAEGGEATLEVNVDGRLEHPVLVVSNYTAASPPTVEVDGAPLAADRDYAASVIPERKLAIITFLQGWSGTQSIAIE